MIDLYSWATPNGRKVSIMLEEVEPAYQVHRIDLRDFPNVRRWYRAVAERPALQRGYHVPGRFEDIPLP